MIINFLIFANSDSQFAQRSDINYSTKMYPEQIKGIYSVGFFCTVIHKL